MKKYRVRVGWGWVFAGMLLGGVCFAKEAPLYIWVEAESATTSAYSLTNWTQEGVSSESVLRFIPPLTEKELALIPEDERIQPEEELLLRYEMCVVADGKYDVWFRAAFDYARTPFEWRIDEAEEWQKVAADLPSVNVMGRGTCLSWINAGSVDLSKGAHSLEIRYENLGKKGRSRFGMDCFALVQGEWIPEGMLKPGEVYTDPKTVDAAKQVYSFEPSATRPEERSELLLSGLWEVARYDDPDMDVDTYEAVKRLPADDELVWRGAEVPGDLFAQRPDLEMAHRVLYRTKVRVSEAFSDKGFHLHFDGSTFIVSVFVNGTYCGSRRSLLVPGDLDVSKAIIPGEENTLVLAVKSPWYARSPGDANPRQKTVPSVEKRRASSSGRGGKWLEPVYPSNKGEGNALSMGLVKPLRLVATGSVYAEDVLIRTSVARKRLRAEIIIRNTAKKPIGVSVAVEAVHEKTGAVEKRIPVKTTIIPAQKTRLIAFDDTWANPKLWWPAESLEDKPDCYLLRTTVSVNDQPVDVQTERFGFREITYTKQHVLLNGIRWHFWGAQEIHADGSEKVWLTKYFKGNNRFHRFGGEDNELWETRKASLDFFDKNGIPGYLGTCVDGGSSSLDLSNSLFWENTEEHITQVINAYKNHPSILMWSLGNEVMFGANKKEYKTMYGQMEINAAKLVSLQKKLDPTRVGFFDGDGSLGGLIDINSQHDSMIRGDGFPSSAYHYLTCKKAFQPRETLTAPERYRWDKKRPLLLGDICFYGGDADQVSWIGGPETFRSGAAANSGHETFVRIVSEGARFQDVIVTCPEVEPFGDGLKKAWSRRAALVREHTSLFFSNTELTRTVRIFNDGRDADPLTLEWKLVLDGATVDSGKKTYTLEPGHWKEDILVASLPAAVHRIDGFLFLELFAKGTRVFQDQKEISVVPNTSVVKNLTAETLGVYDPQKNILAWLDAKQQPYTPIRRLANIPPATQVLIIGNDGLPKPEAFRIKNSTRFGVRPESEAVKQFVSEGNVAIVLEQERPLVESELPINDASIDAKQINYPSMIKEKFDREAGFSGSIVFPVASIHPVLKNLKKRDFFTWQGESDSNFKTAYATPRSGVRSLVQAGDRLDLTLLMEIPFEKGRYLISQLLIGSKLGTEPAADYLLHNALVWASEKARTEPATIVGVVDKPLGEFLLETELKITWEQDIAVALKTAADVLVVEAKPSFVNYLAMHPDEVNTFFNQGGWIMLSGLTTNGLPGFNQLVGGKYTLRDYTAEWTVLDHRDDPLLLGISDRDVKQNSLRQTDRASGTYAPSTNLFFSVIEEIDPAVPSPSSIEPRTTPIYLSSPIGLAKYPIGNGGILLNQIDYLDDDGISPPERRGKKADQGNRAKKLTLFGNLLRNMGEN